MKKTFALLAAGLLTLGACSNDEAALTDSTAAADPGESGFAVDGIAADSAVVALVPSDITARGQLRNGASTDYAPAEYRKADGHTPTGYDIDLTRAIAKKMGLKDGTTTHVEFDSLLPQIGTKFDVGLSTFTVTPEREEAFNMITYFEAGSEYGVPAKSSDFTPDNPCGFTIGVQTGSSQEDALKEATAACEAKGAKPIKIMSLPDVPQIVTRVVSGQYDAIFADSPVLGYAVARSNGQLKTTGDIYDSAPVAIAVAKDNPELAKAVQAALQSLMDSGELKEIFAHYGITEGVLSTAEINPQVQ